jgi:hypothetical protein
MTLIINSGIAKYHHQEFKDFCKDHIQHFNCIPCEFQASDETIYEYKQIWITACELKMYQYIK